MPRGGCVGGNDPLQPQRMKFLRFAAALFLAHVFTGCESTIGPSPAAITAARAGMLSEIKGEPQGAYFVGRRYYKSDYKFWGWVRASGQPWTTAKLVVLNENQKLAPDRATGRLGSDNNVEYKLFGNFSGEKVYEPASNAFYPEFVLKGYEVRSLMPPPIYRDASATNPERRVIVDPY